MTETPSPEELHEAYWSVLLAPEEHLPTPAREWRNALLVLLGGCGLAGLGLFALNHLR